MTDRDDRIAKLESRLAAVEDELAIIRLVASYGPMVDSGNPNLAPTLFDVNGIYDVGSLGRLDPKAFSEMLAGDEHQSLVRTGVSHVMGVPFVRIDGDKATVINPTQLFAAKDDGFSVIRAAYNLWKLERTDHGWKIVERFNRILGVGDDARQLLESSLPPEA